MLKTALNTKQSIRFNELDQHETFNTKIFFFSKNPTTILPHSSAAHNSYEVDPTDP